MKFALQHRTKNDHEGQTISSHCILRGGSFRVVRNASEVIGDEVPVGDVPFIHEVLGHYVEPDYYPKFLHGFLHRNVWRTDSWPYHERCFIKPADRHKRFTGFVKRVGWKGKRRGPFWCSDVVDFISEWRWYVWRGSVVDAKWGSGIETPVPALNIEFPADYSAAVDFGLLSTGEIALIESNSPFACGWYGSLNEGASYAKWLSGCWVDLASKT